MTAYHRIFEKAKSLLCSECQGGWAYEQLNSGIYIKIVSQRIANPTFTRYDSKGLKAVLRTVFNLFSALRSEPNLRSLSHHLSLQRNFLDSPQFLSPFIMASMSEPSDTAITIDPYGDVKLFLDDGTLRVSRTALRRNSSVFRAMLDNNSKFWEASDDAIDRDQLRNIPLREDNFDSMKIVMRIIHQQNDKVPTEVTFDQLDDIAVVCDKYDLRECLMPWSLLWSQPYFENMEQDYSGRWLFMSIVFRNESAFTRITKHLILETTLLPSKLTVHSDIDVGEGCPDEIIRKLLFSRSFLGLVCYFLSILLTELVGQLKEQRATVIHAIEEPCRNLMLKLLHNQERKVCTHSMERNLCDCFNLGYLIRAFPRLCDPEADNDLKISVRSRVEKIRRLVDYYGVDTGYWATPWDEGDHVDCGLNKILYPEVKKVFDAVQGMVLKPRVSKK